MMRRYVISASIAIVLCALLGSAYMAKINSIWGISHAKFSFAQSLMPLAGMFFGLFGSWALFCVMLGLRVSGLISSAYFGLPTFCASLCWATSSKIIRIGIPAISMILFALHPVGSQAIPYTFYWFIPMLCAFARSNNKFLTAVASTFTAHAVGSVLHIYVINAMTPALWMALIPVVACERLIFALGMYAAYGAIVRLLHAASVALREQISQWATTD
jgi:hypothetical protein